MPKCPDIHLIILVCAACCSGVLCTGYIFDKVVSLSNQRFNSTLSTVTTQEAVKLECALRCLRQANCASFSFSQTSRTCSMLLSGGPASNATTEPSTDNTVFYTIHGQGECPTYLSGYFYDRAASLCFKVSDFKVRSWDLAVNTCRTWGMELIKLDSRDRQAAVMETLRANPSWALQSRYLYIGGSRPKSWWGNTSQPDDYFWLDGTPVVWHNSEFWGTIPKQPNGYGTEECLGIYGQGFAIYDRSVNDHSCFICEV